MDQWNKQKINIDIIQSRNVLKMITHSLKKHFLKFKGFNKVAGVIEMSKSKYYLFAKYMDNKHNWKYLP